MGVGVGGWEGEASAFSHRLLPTGIQSLAGRASLMVHFAEAS